MRISSLLVTLLLASLVSGCSEKSSTMSFDDFKAKMSQLGTTQEVQCEQCKGTCSAVCSRCNKMDKSACKTCAGTGKAACVFCKGSARETCERCRGQPGTMGCVWCSGSGKDSEGKSCKNCAGTGKVPCYLCGGKWEFACERCRGSGKQECDDCRGRLVCPWCSGKVGKIVCDRCKGTGKETVYNRPTLSQWEDAFGKPTKKQEIGGARYYYYDCKDGTIQINVYLRPDREEPTSTIIVAGDPNLL
jgi:hypothetical protein